MKLILIFAVLLIGFLIIGTVATIAKNRKDDAEEDPPRVVISQQVPSVFDTFKGKDKK